MRRDSRAQSARAGGFALPLAVMLLVAVSLIATLLFDAALGLLRTSAADLGQARAESAAETALAAALALRLDTSALSVPRGSTLVTTVSPAPDSTTTTVQRLAAPFARIVTRAYVSNGYFRVSVGRVGIVVLTPDSTAGGELLLRPARGPWLVTVP